MKKKLTIKCTECQEFIDGGFVINLRLREVFICETCVVTCVHTIVEAQSKKLKELETEIKELKKKKKNVVKKRIAKNKT